MSNRYCAGFCTSGYWKGKPCGSPSKFLVGRKRYCVTHYTIAINDPDRFTKAKTSLTNRRRKAERALVPEWSVPSVD